MGPVNRHSRHEWRFLCPFTCTWTQAKQSYGQSQNTVTGEIVRAEGDAAHNRSLSTFDLSIDLESAASDFIPLSGDFPQLTAVITAGNSQ